MTGDYEEAIVLLGQAVETATTAGYQPGVTLAANDLAGVLFERGEHVRSFAYFQQALAVAREIGGRRSTLTVIGNIGECYRRRGEYRRAVRCFAQAFRIAAEIGDRTSMVFTTENLAAAVAAQGSEREAEALLVRAVRLADKMDSQYWLCESLHQYALLLASLGRLDDAERASQQALEIAVEHHHGVELQARLLWLRLRVAQDRMDRGTAMGELRRLRDAWVDLPEQAAVLEALWKLDPTQEQLRRDAAALYRALYEQAPTVEYRKAYERLTGTSLEPPPALPRLPEGISGERPDLSEVTAQLDLVLRRVELDATKAG
jgi:tetratricopeptide (TPR) repeat protein